MIDFIIDLLLIIMIGLVILMIFFVVMGFVIPLQKIVDHALVIVEFVIMLQVVRLL